MLVSTAVQIPPIVQANIKGPTGGKKQLQKEVIALPDHYKTF
jgi:hypothetical protein